MTPDEQLDEWVKGNPIHNKDRDECCPDFSCCEPDLLAPENVRIAFRDADEATRTQMLSMFLGQLIELKTRNGGPVVHIAGDTPEEIH